MHFEAHYENQILWRVCLKSFRCLPVCMLKRMISLVDAPIHCSTNDDLKVPCDASCCHRKDSCSYKGNSMQYMRKRNLIKKKETKLKGQNQA